jgi:hypothetical protein
MRKPSRADTPFFNLLSDERCPLFYLPDEHNFTYTCYRSDAVFKIFDFKPWDWLKENSKFNFYKETDPPAANWLAWSYAVVNPEFDSFFQGLDEVPQLLQRVNESAYGNHPSLITYGLEIRFRTITDATLFKLTFS